MRKVWVVVLSSLMAAVLVLPWLGLGATASSVAYDVVAGSALVTGWVALWRRGPVHRGGWAFLLAGFSTWVLGDVVWSLEQNVFHVEAFPAFSDILYLSGYGLLAAGAQIMARSRLRGRDVTALMDACILAAGLAVPAAVFIIVPASSDSSLTVLGKLVSSAYPVGDLVLVAMLARLAATPGARSWSFAAVIAALLTTLGADAWWNVLVLHDPAAQSAWTDGLWLSSYVFLAAAVAHPSMHLLTEPSPERERLASGRRLLLLGIGSLLPALTLFAAGATGHRIPWAVVSIGGAVLTALVLVRMGGLLERVREQAVQLAALSRRDELTGAPNRRSWNYELSRACAQARDSGDPLCVAILDLDHFKRYNDTYGHPAGDLLLREAVAIWTDALQDGEVLARYGGEEFALLMPDTELSDAVGRLEALLLLTPSEQTFSAGVARYLGADDPEGVISAADSALYEAKRSGRARVETGNRTSPDELPEHLRSVKVVLQPIVDVTTGEVVAHEALSRFAHAEDVAGVFAQAHRDGHGDILEAVVIAQALRIDGRPDGTELFVNVSAAAMSSSRFWELLPTDLTGVMVEIIESRTSVDWDLLRPQMDLLLRRGARLAVDDLGAGSGDLVRLLVVRPHVVKIDRMLVDGCSADATRLGLVRVILDLAHASGAVVCAEGVEQAADLQALQSLGVDLVQGFLLGRPGPDWSTEAQLVSPTT